jgi:hypothetical protein
MNAERTRAVAPTAMNCEAPHRFTNAKRRDQAMLKKIGI